MKLAFSFFIFLSFSTFAATIPKTCFELGVPAQSKPLQGMKRQTVSATLTLPERLKLGRDILAKVRYIETTAGNKLIGAVDLGNKFFLHNANDGAFVFAGQFFAEKDGVAAHIMDFAKAPDRDVIVLAGENILAITPLMAKGFLPNDFQPRNDPNFYDLPRRVDKYLNISDCPEFLNLRSPMRVEWAKDGRTFATSANLDEKTGSIRIWNPIESNPEKQMLRQFTTKDPLLINDSSNIGFSADQTILYAFTTKGVEFFEVSTGKILSNFALPEGHKSLGISLSSDLRAAAIVFRDARKNTYSILVDILTQQTSHHTFLGDRYVNIKNVFLDVEKNKISINYRNMVAQIPLDDRPSSLVMLGNPSQLINIQGGEFAQEPASFVNSQMAIDSGPAPLTWTKDPDGMGGRSNSFTAGDEIRIYRLD